MLSSPDEGMRDLINERTGLQRKIHKINNQYASMRRKLDEEKLSLLKPLEARLKEINSEIDSAPKIQKRRVVHI